MPTAKTSEIKNIIITIKLDTSAEAILESTKVKLSDLLEEWCEKQFQIDIVPRGKIAKRTSTTVTAECLAKLRNKANELGISVNTLINSIIKAKYGESSDI